VPDPVSDIQAEDVTFHQFETQGIAIPDDDDDDDFGIPPPPPVPPCSHDHEAGSSRAAPPTVDPALAVILQSLTQQQALIASEQARQAAEQARQAAVQHQMSERMLSLFQTIQDRQDTLQQQFLAYRAEQRAFMTHILQHTGV
jgi:septal ring factor EnvC (AmiA/AmiB activator)